MKKRFIILLILITFCISFTGCWDQKPFQQTGFILNVGIESSDNEKLKLTYTSPVIERGKNQVELITEEAKLVREGREKARLSSAKTLEAGKIQQVLVSDELAAKGVHNLLEVFERDPANPALAWVVVVEGSPSELLKASLTFSDKPRPAIYINQLLEDAYKSSKTPHTKVYDFDIDYYAPGLDPITPIVRLSENKITLTGCALFSGDKLVGKLNVKQTSLLLAAMNQFEKGNYMVTKIQDNQAAKSLKCGAIVNVANVKRKIKTEIYENKPVVDIKLAFTVYLDEHNYDDGKAFDEKLEAEIADDMKSNYKDIIEKLMQCGSDPIGIGDMIRAEHYDYWKKVKWEDAYKNTVINIDTSVNILHHGVIN